MWCVKGMGRRRIGSGVGEVGSWGGVGVGVEIEIEGEGEVGEGEGEGKDERYPG
jgi:hypothetical protein